MPDLGYRFRYIRDCSLIFAPQLPPAQLSLLPCTHSFGTATSRMVSRPEKFWVARDLFGQLVYGIVQGGLQGILR